MFSEPWQVSVLKQERKRSKVSSPNYPASSYQCQASLHCCIPLAAQHHQWSHPIPSSVSSKKRQDPTVAVRGEKVLFKQDPTHQT